MPNRPLHPNGIGLIHESRVPATYRAPFLRRVIAIADSMDIPPDWLMICMCFETGCSFRANLTNPYSGATGLIQFIPSTAQSLGITTAQLRRQTPVEQLGYVHKYLRQWQSKYKSVHDVYIAIFAPAFVGSRDQTVLYRANGRTPLDRRRYQLNRALDANKDGLITIADVKRQLQRVIPKEYRTTAPAATTL